MVRVSPPASATGSSSGFRGSPGTRRGHGLGLALVKVIAVRHGLAAWFEDADPGGALHHRPEKSVMRKLALMVAAALTLAAEPPDCFERAVAALGQGQSGESQGDRAAMLAAARALNASGAAPVDPRETMRWARWQQLTRGEPGARSAATGRWDRAIGCCCSSRARAQPSSRPSTAASGRGSLVAPAPAASFQLQVTEDGAGGAGLRRHAGTDAVRLGAAVHRPLPDCDRQPGGKFEALLSGRGIGWPVAIGMLAHHRRGAGHDQPRSRRGGGACRDTTAQPVQVSPAMQPYADRYNALLVADPYHLIDTDQPQWRALVADLKGNAAAPADLVARSEMMLAGSLKGDAEVAESLAVAKSALALG